MIIGVAGPIGSGKTTAAKYLSSTYLLSYLRYSKVLKEMLGLESADRKTLRERGWKVMSQGQQTALNQKLLSKIKEGENYVIDGLRHPVDFETLKGYSKGTFLLLYIEASAEIRWQRLKLRPEFTQRADFQAADAHSVEVFLPSLREKAYQIIKNEGSITELHAKLDAAYQRLGEGPK